MPLHICLRPLFFLPISIPKDELKAKNKHLKKTKEQLKAQQQEIDDLHAEFERERQSLLDEVRRSEQTLKFHQQYLDRVLPTIRCASRGEDGGVGGSSWGRVAGRKARLLLPG